MHAMASGCYAMDSVLMLLFAAAGTVTWAVALGFAAAAAVSCVVYYLVLASALPERMRDANLTTWHVSSAAAIQLVLLAVAPQLAFFYFLILFNIFAFGALRMSVRDAVVAWLLIALATGAVLLWSAAPLTLPHDTPLERALVWLAFVLVLGRCVFVGLYATALQKELRKRNAALADSVRRIEELASRDELTGVLNRRSLLMLLGDQIAAAVRDERRFAVALLDLDRFKEVNDRLGHPTGDEVLIEFARIATGALRASDRLGRYGGDEFLLVMPDTSQVAAAAVVARLHAAFEAFDWQRLTPGLGLAASAGIAEFTPGDTPTSLIRRADTALYADKRARAAASAAALTPLRANAA